MNFFFVFIFPMFSFQGFWCSVLFTFLFVCHEDCGCYAILAPGSFFWIWLIIPDDPFFFFIGINILLIPKTPHKRRLTLLQLTRSGVRTDHFRTIAKLQRTYTHWKTMFWQTDKKIRVSVSGFVQTQTYIAI